MRPLLALFALICPFAANSQSTNSFPRLAHEARIDLYATPQVGSLDQGEVLESWATISRLSWMKPTEQQRAYSFVVPLLPSQTNQCVIQFVPRESGRVTASLLGPYERVPNDKEALYKSEIVWPSFDVAGASFSPESAALVRPPLRSWFKQRYDIGLLVRAQTPVTIRVGAAALLPESGAIPNQTLSTDILGTAATAVGGFKRGISITGQHAFGASQSRRFPDPFQLKADDFTKIKSEGFDHVRILLPFHLYSGLAPEYTLQPQLLEKLERVVTDALSQGLHIIVGWQEYDTLATIPNVEGPRFLEVWKQLSQRFRQPAEQLAFELWNTASLKTPLPVGTPQVNPQIKNAISTIRTTAPDRLLFISPGMNGSAAEVVRLDLPPSDSRLVISVSSREPVWFTHQHLFPQLKAQGGLRFPGPPDVALPLDLLTNLDSTQRDWLLRYASLPAGRNPSGSASIQPVMQFLKQWSATVRRPVYVSDWGCPDQVDASSRARFYSTWRSQIEEAGMGWGVLDWNQSCRYWDESALQPMVGLRESLFPGRVNGSGAKPMTDASNSGKASGADALSLVPLQHALKQIDTLREQVNLKEQRSQLEMDAIKAQANRFEQSARAAHDDAIQSRSLTRWTLGITLALTAIFILATIFYSKRHNLSSTDLALALHRHHDADTSADSIREGTMAHLARLLSDKVVQRLLAERRLSQEAQHSAALELAVMEERLEHLQAPLQQRVEAYEARIHELETELTKRGEENRELIRAKIDLTRQRMQNAQMG